MNVSVVAGKQSVSTGENAIRWAPLSQAERLAFNGTSYQAVHRALFMAFGDFPIRLSRPHLETLHGMACAAGEGDKPYRQLFDALTMFGELEITTV